MASVTQQTLQQELMLEQLKQCFNSEQGARNYFAGVRQTQIARELGRDRKAIDGLGAPKAEIDNDVYMYWVMRCGRKIWKDKSFLKWFQNRHPETRVQSKGTRIQSGYGGLSGRATKRFRKVYAESKRPD